MSPDVIALVAFGQILSKELLDLPRLGAINLHASLLPKYRGVAPINWAIVNGETETGVTTMYMAEKVDAGEIILTRKTPIHEHETAGELYVRLAEIGAELLAETMGLVARGEAPRVPQESSGASYARKLRKRDGEIDWSEAAPGIANRIRGMTPWPGAFTWYRGKSLKILEARACSEPTRAGEPGEILTIDEDRGIEVAAGTGSVLLLCLKPEGRRQMDAASFARGYRPRPGTRPFEKP
jgi:methionyl-tRNA formyltransferase